MNNFIFENTTKVYFGQGGVKEYLESLLANYGSNVLLAYGGGSIKRNGVYAEVTDILHRAGKMSSSSPASCPTPPTPKCRRARSWQKKTMLT